MSRKQKNAELTERKQQRVDAGPMSAHYPDIVSIIISMDYYQASYSSAVMQRTVNFSSDSSAYFHMECMDRDCLDGGYNLAPVIKSMVKGRLEKKKGEIACPGNSSPGHARIEYKISIQYNKAVRK
jgi:hypothetical protein